MDYEHSLLESAVESKAMEGLGEAAPQLLLQSYILTNTLLYKDGPEIVLDQTNEYFFSVHSKAIVKFYFNAITSLTSLFSSAAAASAIGNFSLFIHQGPNC